MSLPGNNDDQFVTMPKRTMYDLLSEELRRLDPDDVYGDVLAAAFPLTGDPNSFAVGKPESSNVVSDDMDAVVKAVAKDAVSPTSFSRAGVQERRRRSASLSRLSSLRSTRRSCTSGGVTNASSRRSPRTATIAP